MHNIKFGTLAQIAFQNLSVIVNKNPSVIENIWLTRPLTNIHCVAAANKICVVTKFSSYQVERKQFYIVLCGTAIFSYIIFPYNEKASHLAVNSYLVYALFNIDIITVGVFHTSHHNKNNSLWLLTVVLPIVST